jgi:hypothetical protein
VEDLFYYVLERKYLFPGADISNGVAFKELEDTADKNLPRKIRQLQEDRTIRLFGALGMTQQTSEAIFEVGNKAETRAARRFGWIASRPFMADFRTKARDFVNSNQFNVPTLYAMATDEVKWQLFLHIENKNKNYTLSIDWELEAYLQHKDFLERTYAMSMNSLHGKKLPKYLPDN